METYFPYIIDYEFTANMEKKLDEISNGKMTKIQVMGSFYKQLMEQITKVSGTKMDKITINSDKVIGQDGEIIYYVTKTKFGDAIKWEEDGEIKYKSLKYLDTSLSNLNLDLCLAFIKYPIDLSDEIKLYKNFKNGTLYLGYNKKYFTVEKEDITLSEAKEVIKGGGKTDESKTNDKFMKDLSKDIKLGKGKYGFYILHNKKFYKAPSDKVTLEEAKKIILEGKKK